MVCLGCRYLKILRAIVGLDAVSMMDLLTWRERPSEHHFSNEPVFIDVTTHVGHWMLWALHQYVPIRSYRATALPVRISRSRMNDSHRQDSTIAAIWKRKEVVSQ